MSGTAPKAIPAVRKTRSKRRLRKEVFMAKKIHLPEEKRSRSLAALRNTVAALSCAACY
jgi:hypothetical protein